MSARGSEAQRKMGLDAAYKSYAEVLKDGRFLIVTGEGSIALDRCRG